MKLNSTVQLICWDYVLLIKRIFPMSESERRLLVTFPDVIFNDLEKDNWEVIGRMSQGEVERRHAFMSCCIAAFDLFLPFDEILLLSKTVKGMGTVNVIVPSCYVKTQPKICPC